MSACVIARSKQRAEDYTTPGVYFWYLLGHEGLGAADVLADVTERLVLVVALPVGLDDVGVVGDADPEEAEP